MNQFLTESDLNARLPAWLERVEEFRPRFRHLDPKHSALIVVDMQTEFLACDGLVPLWGGPAILPRVKRMIDCFRNANRPVIYTKHCYYNAEVDGGATGEWWRLDRNSPLLKAGRPQTEIHPDITPRSDEYVLIKQRYSGFFQTNLESLLRKLQIRDVVISGVATNGCCESTAHDAFFRDFHIFFLADGTGGRDEESHVGVLRDIAWLYGTVLTCEDLINQFTKSA
jgi:nicotinamidase-related amidase